jgi:hypothetical protein
MKQVIQNSILGAIVAVSALASSTAKAESYSGICSTNVTLEQRAPNWAYVQLANDLMTENKYSLHRDASFRASDFKNIPIAQLPGISRVDLALSVVLGNPGRTAVCDLELQSFGRALNAKFGGRVGVKATIYQCGYIYRDGALVAAPCRGPIVLETP